jgi:hypothetical protein
MMIARQKVHFESDDMNYFQIDSLAAVICENSLNMNAQFSTCRPEEGTPIFLTLTKDSNRKHFSSTADSALTVVIRKHHKKFLFSHVEKYY